MYISAYNLYLKASLTNTQSIQTALLLEEGVEAVKQLRDASWTNNIAALTNDTPYYLAWDSASSTWQATTTPMLVDSYFARTFTLSSAYRDSSENLTSSSTSGATLDTGVRELAVTVSWSDRGATTTRSLYTYITNLFGN